MEIEEKRDIALFGIMLAEATKGQLEELARSMVWTDGAEMAVTPFDYDIENNEKDEAGLQF